MGSGGRRDRNAALKRWKDYEEKALFGLIDGLNGAVGLVIGLLHAKAAASLIFVALLSRAGASGVSMGGAQYQADETVKDPRVRAGRVAAMALGYITSALLPGLGFALNLHVGIVLFVPATIAVLAAITWTRAREAGFLRAAITTLVIFVSAVVAGLLASLAGG